MPLFREKIIFSNFIRSITYKFELIIHSKSDKSNFITNFDVVKINVYTYFVLTFNYVLNIRPYNLVNIYIMY